MRALDAPSPQEEVELKLAIGSASARLAADHEVGRAPVRPVETIYYDTPKRRLQSAGFSLRLRRDGESWSQSVKAASGLRRFEQETPLRAGMPDFSLLDGTPLADLIGADGGLSPVFVTRVNRRSRQRSLDNSRIELSLDEGLVIANSRSWPIHELELELKSGEPRALFDTGCRLAEDADFTPAFMSKAERGFALADGMLGEAVHFGVRALDPSAAATRAFRTIARRCLNQLALNAELIRGGASLEATHQARTALRRLRVAVGLFSRFLDPLKSETVKHELRWLTAELAPSRSLDVLFEEVFQRRAHEIADRTAAAEFGRLLLAAQEKAHHRARTVVAGPRFRLLLIDIARWIEIGLASDSSADAVDPPISDYAITALEERRLRLVRELDRLDWDDVHARHKARISAKKMRYAAEFFVDLGPRRRTDRYRPFLEATAGLQTCLGHLNDMAEAENLTPSLLAGQSQAVAYAAGLIVGRCVAGTDKEIRMARREAAAFKSVSTWW